MTPLTGSIPETFEWIQIGTLSSDIEIALGFRYYYSNYSFNLAYRKTDNTWAYLGFISETPATGLNLDFILVVSVVRSNADPTKL